AWIYSHLPLAIALTMAGIGAEELVAASAGHEFESSLRWVSVIGVSGAYLAMAMILTSSTSSTANVHFPKKALFRLIAAAAVVLLGATGGQLRPAAFVIILAAITVIEVFLDLAVDMAGRQSSTPTRVVREGDRSETKRLRVRFHGVRGSMTNPDPAVARYGGDTLCIEIDTTDSSHRLIVDAGTGIRSVDVPASDDESGLEVDVLLSHFHLDHLGGLPFFAPIYQPQHTFHFHGRAEGMTVHEAIDGALRPPWFPVPVCDSPSKKTFTDLDGEPFEIDGMQITPIWLNHPQGVTGYRIERDGVVVVIATDHESGDAEADARLVEAARGANLLVHDAQYIDADYVEHEGWGHSTWQRAIEAAEAAGVERLLTVSHDIHRTDTELDAIVAKVQAERPWVDAARSGLVVEL
ncbi:MAG: MBL fold metallo-hydrolase, partial [Dehalococcoidia bacterium]|nr:MBL fold metallo-hydrolase [Dehalococcoidia bacterium]